MKIDQREQSNGEAALPRNLIDRAIGVFSPRLELQRVRARLAMQGFERAFEGASRGRRTQNWKTSNADMNALLGSLPLLRSRCRDLVRNNPYAGEAVRVIQGKVVGIGIIPQAKSEDEKLKKRADDLWTQWGDETLCHAEGDLDFYGIQSLVMRTVPESGSILIRRRRRRQSDNLPVPLQLQVLEPDFLDCTKDGVLNNGNLVIRGIEFNRIGQRVAYHLYEEHPGGRTLSMKSLESRRIPADDIIHIFRVERAGQVDGVPWGAPCIIRMRDLDEYEDAELIRQKIAACYVAFVHDIEALGDESDATAKARQDALARMEPGIVETLPPGKDVKFGSPPVSQGYDAYTSTVLRSISCGFGVTYESLTHDYSRVNFSSGRMGWIDEARNVNQWRHHMLIPKLCRGVWRWFIEAAMIEGTLTKPVGSTWTSPRREMIDPVKETDAIKQQMRIGILSPSEAVREQGKDPDEVFGEYVTDYERFDKLGLIFDGDPRKRSNIGYDPNGKGGGAASSTTSDNGDGEAKAED